MWNTLGFEKKLKEQLQHQFGEEQGDAWFSKYTAARNCLIADNFFSEIKGKEPNLTDHSERHIANVMTNAEKLLGDDFKRLSGADMYCLALVILFHDVGNIEGRDGHNLEIADVYNFVRKKEPTYNHERIVVTKVAQSHCGKAKDGSRDTLKSLEEIGNLEGEKIMLRSIAAILRLADELAEGNQRTSNFMVERHKYDADSQIFHRYAQMTQVFIDRGSERISITYNIDIDGQSTREDLKEILEFVYTRVIKLDEERRYTKHYSDLLLPFKKTSIQLNFSKDGIPVNLDFEKVELYDHFPVPGEMAPDLGHFQLKHNHLEIDKILDSLIVKEPNMDK